MDLRPRVLALTGALVAACGEPPSSTSSDASALPLPEAALARSVVSYHEHVQPILARSCVQCHVPGQIAPFALDTYDRARPLARQIASAARARTMPPFLADNSGACGSFREALWLREDEIATLEAWAAQGAPPGAASAPAPPVDPPRLSGELHALVTPEYAPDTTRSDDYRCFVLEPQRTEGAYFVTGFDVRPGDTRLVHHVIVYHPQSDEEARKARALDAADTSPGYTCFGGAGVRAGTAAAWAPGGGATRYPENLGVELAGGRPLIVQVHYNTLAGVGSDRTTVQLEVRSEGVGKGRFIPLADPALSLSPGRSDASAGATLRIADYTNIRAPVRVFGVFPHMHTLGTSMRVEIVRDDGSRACIVDVPRWDFHWQRLYFHVQPLALSPADQLSIRCRYDTRERTEVTRWGEGTQDEMCVAGIFIAL